MSDTVVFLDANVLASPVTRTLVLAGGRTDGLLLTWSAHVEAEADRHARGASSRTSVVRQGILCMELSKSAPTTAPTQGGQCGHFSSGRTCESGSGLCNSGRILGVGSGA